MLIEGIREEERNENGERIIKLKLETKKGVDMEISTPETIDRINELKAPKQQKKQPSSNMENANTPSRNKIRPKIDCHIIRDNDEKIRIQFKVLNVQDEDLFLPKVFYN